MGTEAADRELQEFRDRAGGVATSSFFYHYARLHIQLVGSSGDVVDEVWRQ